MERLTKYDEFGNAELVGIDNTKLYERLVCDETVALTTAIAKLKQKAIVPKFGLGQPCFIIWIDGVMLFHIEKIIMELSKDEEETSVDYLITNHYGYALTFPEEEIFATK